MFLSNVNTNVEALRAITDMVEAQIETLTKKADDVIGKPMKVGSWPDLSKFEICRDKSLNTSTSYLFTYKPYYGSETEISNVADLDKRLELIITAWNKYGEALGVCREENAEAIQNNKNIIEKVGNIFKHLGVPSYFTTYELPSSRSTRRKEVTKQAGWPSDLARTIPTSVSGTAYNVEQKVAEAREKHSSIVRTIAKAEQDKIQEAKKVEDAQKIVFYRVKYTPTDALSSVEGVLEAVLGKCKYLHLAHYMQENRGDWTDGYDLASTGLNGFTVITAEDAEIEKEISGLIDDADDYDGRCFRDCEYNYSYLFGKVDPDLYADYCNVVEMIKD